MTKPKSKLPRGLTWDETREQYRIQFVSKHTRPKKQYKERLPPGTTKRQAETYLNKLRESDRVGELLWPNERTAKKETPTFRQYATETYLPHAKIRLKESTIEYKCYKYKQLDRWFGDTPLDEITLADFAQWQIERKSEGIRSRSLNMEARELLTLLRHAKKLGVIDKVIDIEMVPVRDNKPTRSLSEAEAMAALGYAKERSHMWYTLTLFLLHTGARWGDVRWLLWSDVDLDAGLVHFRAENAKHGEHRQVPLVPPVVEALRLIEPVGDEVFARICQNTGNVIPLRLSARLWHRYPWQGPGDECKFGPHTFRHTFATWKLRAGVSIALVSKWLGHRSITMTVDKYGHIEPAHTQDEIMRGPIIELPRLRVVGE